MMPLRPVGGQNSDVTRLRAVWDRIRRADPLVKDGALAAIIASPIVALALAAALHLVHSKALSSEVPPMLVLILPVALRRRQPLLAASIQLVVLAAGLPMWPDLAERFPVSISILLAAYSTGAHSRSRLASMAVVAGGSVALLVATVHGGTGYSFLLLDLAWLFGNFIRAERRNHALVAERATQLEREHETARRTAAAAERARIAREMHDIIAHTVSVMTVQAEAARRVMSKQPEAAAEALREVSASGHQTLAELRRLLGLLGERESDPLEPQPGLADVPSLVDSVRNAGLPVELRIEGAPQALPAGLDLTAYRVVQEALTNALKHSGRAHTKVIVCYGEADIRIEVADVGRPGWPASAEGAGRGLVGMRERVAMYGGEMEASPRSRGFGVRVRLPLTAPA
jgi:signal transduction histidine kinase